MKKDVFLQVVPVVIRSAMGNQYFSTYALLDDVSKVTIMRDDIAYEINLDGINQSLNVSTVIQKSKESLPSKEVTITVLSRDKEYELEIECVSLVPAERFNMPGRPCLQDADYFTHLDGVDTHAVSPDEITLLIGGDEPEAHIISDV